MVPGSYVRGTSFVGVDVFRSEDGIRKDVKQRLMRPFQGTLSTLLLPEWAIYCHSNVGT